MNTDDDISAWRLVLLVQPLSERQKTSQDVIRALHNSASDAVRQASGLELAPGSCCTHAGPLCQTHLH